MYENWNEKESSVVVILCFFLIKKCFFSIYHQVSPIYIIRYMLICKNNSKFAYKLLSADGVYVNN